MGQKDLPSQGSGQQSGTAGGRSAAFCAAYPGGPGIWKSKLSAVLVQAEGELLP